MMPALARASVSLITVAGCSPLLHEIGGYKADARKLFAVTMNSTEDRIANDGKYALRGAIIAASTNVASGGTAGEYAAATTFQPARASQTTDSAGKPHGRVD